MKRGIDVLRDPFLNKGTAFTNEERKEYGLVGMLPIGVQSIEDQAKQTYEHYQSKPNNFEKRKFLMEIFNTNRTLFYSYFYFFYRKLWQPIKNKSFIDSIKSV